MEIKRIKEIYVETKRRFVIRQTESAKHVVCPECAEPMMAAEQAAILFGISRRAVYRTVENGNRHFAETCNGVLFVCPNTLAEILTEQERKHEIT